MVRMWLYPYLTWFAIAAIAVVIGSMAFVEDVRSQLWLGLLSVAVVAVAFLIKNARSDAGEGDPPVRDGRFSTREDRERDPAATALE